MVKYIQNKISESSWSLPVTSLYICIIWVLCGGVNEKWWLQFACLAVTTYFIVQLNNRNVLIRIYSRMVSCTFLTLMGCACFLFPSIKGAITSLFFVLSYLFLFACYQDETSAGKTYYAFLALGLASFGHVHSLYFVPLLWIFASIYLSSLSWQSFLSSLLGIITPYWFALCWFLYQDNPAIIINHFKQIFIFKQPFDFSNISQGQIATFVLLIVFMIIGIIHCLRKRYTDNIRTRMFYNIFIWTDILAALFLAIQPQHFNFFIRIMIINTAPIIAHFFALTSTKITNIVFCLLTVTTFILTLYNLWTTSSLF